MVLTQLLEETIATIHRVKVNDYRAIHKNLTLLFPYVSTNIKSLLKGDPVKRYFEFSKRKRKQNKIQIGFARTVINLWLVAFSADLKLITGLISQESVEIL